MTDEKYEKYSLANQLGGSVPEGIAELADEQRQVLADALREARRSQANALAHAGEESLRYVPGPLRAAVRKAVGL